MAAGAGGDPAAERGELEALRIVPQRQPVRAQLRLERRPEHAGLDARRAAGAVDLQHPGEPFEVERQRRGVAGADRRLDAADDARAAAERHDRDVAARGPVEQVDDLGLAARKGDPVGHVRHVAQPHAQAVGIALAEAVGQAVVGPIGQHRREGRRGGDAGRTQGELGERRFGDRVRGVPAQQPDESVDGLPLRRGQLLVLVAPAPEAAHGQRRKRCGSVDLGGHERS